MARLRYNGLVATLDSGGLTSGATTITFTAALTSATGAVPTLAAGDYIPLVILDSTQQVKELVNLTAYTSGATTGTIARAQEGTTAVAHAGGVKVVHGPTAADNAGTIVVRARLTTTKTGLVGGTTTDIAPVTEDEDTAGAHNATTGVFTVPAGQGGLYLITYAYRADNTSGSNGTGTMWIAVNGTAKRPGIAPGPTTTPIVEISGGRHFRLAAGDTVKFQFQASGATVKLWGMSDSFDTGYEIVKISG